MQTDAYFISNATRYHQVLKLFKFGTTTELSILSFYFDNIRNKVISFLRFTLKTNDPMACIFLSDIFCNKKTLWI